MKPEEEFFYDIFSFFFDLVVDEKEQAEQQQVITVIRNSLHAQRANRKLMKERVVDDFNSFKAGSGIAEYVRTIKAAADEFEQRIELAAGPVQGPA